MSLIHKFQNSDCSTCERMYIRSWRSKLKEKGACEAHDGKYQSMTVHLQCVTSLLLHKNCFHLTNTSQLVFVLCVFISL